MLPSGDPALYMIWLAYGVLTLWIFTILAVAIDIAELSASGLENRWGGFAFWALILSSPFFSFFVASQLFGFLAMRRGVGVEHFLDHLGVGILFHYHPLARPSLAIPDLIKI